MLISKITANPLLRQNKQLSVAGVVRATYEEPFPFFMLEDQTGTLFCQTNSELPVRGAHMKVHGKFFVGIPEKCGKDLGPIGWRIRLAILKGLQHPFQRAASSLPLGCLAHKFNCGRQVPCFSGGY